MGIIQRSQPGRNVTVVETITIQFTNRPGSGDACRFVLYPS